MKRPHYTLIAPQWSNLFDNSPKCQLERTPLHRMWRHAKQRTASGESIYRWGCGFPAHQGRFTGSTWHNSCFSSHCPSPPYPLFPTKGSSFRQLHIGLHVFLNPKHCLSLHCVYTNALRGSARGNQMRIENYSAICLCSGTIVFFQLNWWSG